MRIILEPKVYLIGQQTHGMDLLQYLIDNEGVQWSTHADSSGEVLCEVGVGSVMTLLILLGLGGIRLI